jgi:hypothetical protein
MYFDLRTIVRQAPMRAFPAAMKWELVRNRKKQAAAAADDSPEHFAALLQREQRSVETLQRLKQCLRSSPMQWIRAATIAVLPVLITLLGSVAPKAQGGLEQALTEECLLCFQELLNCKSASVSSIVADIFDELLNAVDGIYIALGSPSLKVKQLSLKLLVAFALFNDNGYVAVLDVMESHRKASLPSRAFRTQGLVEALLHFDRAEAVASWEFRRWLMRFINTLCSIGDPFTRLHLRGELRALDFAPILTKLKKEDAEFKDQAWCNGRSLHPVPCTLHGTARVTCRRRSSRSSRAKTRRWPSHSASSTHSRSRMRW